MTSLFATRRRVEDFARHVEQQRPSHDPNLAPLLELVALFRPAAVEPSPAFCSALRGQLMAVAAELPQPDRAEPVRPPESPRPPRPPRNRGRRRRATVAAVAGVAAAGTAFAVAAVAQDALPGDALYPVKTRLEGAQVAVATNPESRGRQYLGLSEHRLAEVRALVGEQPAAEQPAEDVRRRKTELVESALRSFTKEASTGGKLLVEAHRGGESEASLDRLRQFTSKSSDQLAAIEPMLSDKLRPAYDDAVGTLDGLRLELNQLCVTCLPGGGTPLGPNQRDPDEPRSPVPTTDDQDPNDKADRKQRDRPDTPAPTDLGPIPPTSDPETPSPTDSNRLPLPTELPLPTKLPLPLADGLTGALADVRPTVPLVGDPLANWPTALPLPLPVPGLAAADQPSGTPPQSEPTTEPTDGPTNRPTGTPTPTPGPTDPRDPTATPTDGDPSRTPTPDRPPRFRLPLFGLEIGIG